MENKIAIDDQTSKRINILKILMSILVVIGHSNVNATQVKTLAMEGKTIIYNPGIFSGWVQDIFFPAFMYYSLVPLFFIFSSVIVFKKNYKYVTLIKKRFLSLFLPFILWPLINILLYIISKELIIKLLPGKQILLNESIEFYNWKLKQWISCFLGYGRGGSYPYLGQFWFVRDLIILSFLTPILKWLCEKFSFITLVFILFLYLNDVPLFLIEEQSLFYYTLGYFWAKYDLKIFESADRIKWIPLIILFLFCSYAAYGTSFQNYPAPSRMVGFVSILILLKISKNILENEKLYNISLKLLPYSFFIYCAHQPFISKTVINICLRIAPMKNGFLCLLSLVMISTFTLTIVIAAAIFSRRFLPGLFSILCGGRITKKTSAKSVES